MMFNCAEPFERLEAWKELDFGYIYVLSNEGYQANLYKVGMTRSGIKQRIQALQGTGVPGKFICHLLYFSPYIAKTEKYIHLILEKYRTNGDREFFQCDIQTLSELIVFVLRGIDSIARQYCRRKRINLANERHRRQMGASDVLGIMGSTYPLEYYNVPERLTSYSLYF